MARRSRQQYAVVSEIGPIPPVADAKRKKAGRRNLYKFLTHYFPHSTGLRPFSRDHRSVIHRMQRCILDGGRVVNAVYREFAKTTIAENSILWATLYGHRQFGLVTGLNKAASTANIDSIKSELSENELLAGDFPEVCFPIQALEGKAQRCAGQTCAGKSTKIVWRADTVVLPTIDGSPAEGAVIMAKPFARARGVKHKRHDGVNARPDLILVDDPQDNAAAASPLQVGKNLNVLRKTLLHAASHRTSLAIVVNGTVIAKNDMIEQLLSDTSWQGVRIAFMPKPADSHEGFWLKDYAAARRSFDRSVPDDKQRAEARATALYVARRREADAGCQISWKERYTAPAEISAVQHAYNVLIDDGAEVFASEYQNEPLDARAAGGKLTAAMVAAKINGLARGATPKTAEFLTAYIDVHLRLLYYVVAAWSNPLQGAVVDYGTYPRQPVAYFAQATAPIGMDDLAQQQPGGMTEDAWLLCGLQKLTDGILAKAFPREDGAEMHVGQLLIDARWGEKNALVKQFCRRHPQGGTRLLAGQGIGIGPAQKMFEEYNPEPGTRQGYGWRIAPAKAGDRWVTIDVNLCKSLVAGRLALPVGTAGGIELFGADGREHTLFADHCVAEAPVETTAKGRTRDVWEWLLPHNDNHWWDCLVGSLVAAQMLGCRPAEWGHAPVRKRIRLSEIQKSRP